MICGAVSAGDALRPSPSSRRVLRLATGAARGGGHADFLGCPFFGWSVRRAKRSSRRRFVLGSMSSCRRCSSTTRCSLCSRRSWLPDAVVCFSNPAPRHGRRNRSDRQKSVHCAVCFILTAEQRETSRDDFVCNRIPRHLLQGLSLKPQRLLVLSGHHLRPTQTC